LRPQIFYDPGQTGFEKNISDYLKWIKE